MKPKPERRLQQDLRKTVTKYTADGYEITNRDPLTLIRGRHMRYLDKGVLKEDLVPQLREAAQ